MQKWQNLVTRRLAAQVAIAWNYGFGKLFHMRYRTGIYNTLVYYNGSKTDYFVLPEELEQYNRDLDRSLDNHEFVSSMISEGKEFVEETYAHIKQLVKSVDKLSDKELSQLYTNVSYHHANYYTRMWMVFRIGERIEKKIAALLKDKKELLRTLSIPLKPNDVTNERMDLLKIACKRGSFVNSKLKDLLAVKLLYDHTEKYKHIPMYDFDHSPYTFDHFQKELDLIENPEEELEEIESTFSEREAEFKKIMQDLNPGHELESLIKMLKKAVILRDYRDMIRQKLNLCLKDFYMEIGKRIGLAVEETALLTNDEIEHHLANSAQFSKNEIEKRKQSFILIQHNDHIEIHSGEKAHEKAEQYALYSIDKSATELKGILASPGKAKGKAKIINTNLDFNKIKPGDILITSMTRQDFVPVMRKAAAIVTNEGGQTCHAAIIARELNKPCIVGTKNATDMFSDGDLIEVNGGNVRRLE